MSDLMQLIGDVNFSGWLATGAKMIADSATVILVGITAIYVWLTKRILDVQNSPAVIVSLVPDIEQPAIFMLVIKNIGNAMAYDIDFKLSHPIPKNVNDLNITNEAKDIMDSGPLIDGVPALEPGGTRSIAWGYFEGITHALKGKKLVITCCFKRGRKKMPPILCPIDINSFDGTGTFSKGTAKLVKAVENIGKGVNSISTDLKESFSKNTSDT